MDADGHRPGDARDATLQRLAQKSPQEHEERLRYDSQTVLELQLSGWSAEAWSPVAEALAEYGFAVMVGWLFTGKVFAEVSKVGQPVRPCPSWWLDDDAVTSLADETVAIAIDKFQQVLMVGKWEAGKGASLATYFVGQCKFQFSNVYRSWFAAEERRRGEPVVYGMDSLAERDTAAQAVGIGDAAGILGRMPALVAEVFRLKYLEGFSYKEIANLVDGVKDAKMAENMVTREKARWVERKRVG